MAAAAINMAIMPVAAEDVAEESGANGEQQPHTEADKIDKKSIHKRPRDWFCPS